MPNEGPSRVFTFWGMVGAVMVALKLKENYDDYKRVSSEEDGLGPVALRSPIGEGYRDDSDNATVTDGLLDTEIPGTRPKRARRRDCCVCCGLQCGLFWKAFGIVSLIVILWQAGRLILWAATPSPTGLENMPTFSESLGCLDAKAFYQDQEINVLNIPLNSRLDHSIDLRGGFSGTFTVAHGASDATEVKYELTVRGSDVTQFQNLVLRYPANEEIEDGSSHSALAIYNSAPTEGACSRFDIKMYIPPNLKKLHIQAHATTHILFDEKAEVDLDNLYVTMYTNNQENMLLPHPTIRAKDMRLEMTRGWLVGEASLVEKTYITTQRGDATANVKILPLPSLEETPAPAILQTTTGAGRTDIVYVPDHGAPHRPIEARHMSSRNGDLYLTYKEAEFMGTIEFDAKSYSATGVQGLMERNATNPAWVGDKYGVDRMTVQSKNGWVGLYF